MTDDMKLEDLELPYIFQAESVEGIVEARIVRTPEDSYFRDCSPYMLSVNKLNLWGDYEGTVTLGEIREQIKSFEPKDFEP